MKLNSFRVENFRSIVDSGWCDFSPDGITVLIGQNESGKTSILSALSKLDGEPIVEDDCRILAPLPTIWVNLQISAEEIERTLLRGKKEQPSELRLVIQEFVDRCNGRLVLKLSTEANAEDPDPYSFRAEIDDEVLAQNLTALSRVNHANEATVGVDGIFLEGSSELKISDVAKAVWYAIPNPVLFDEKAGHLPDRVDITKNKEGKWVLTGDGAIAARNFLTIAGLKVDDLIKAQRRERENVLSRANAKISAMFRDFWTQTIGNQNQLELICDVQHYGPEPTEKAGQPHFTFWIKDGPNSLYPKQRSQGTRWFISFFLQLAASKQKDTMSIFLLDEPGANLHGKAQADVLKLLNTLKDGMMIVYSTHTPGLVEYDKLYRVLAVQRDGKLDESPTVVIDAHRLGTASRDTLSPLLVAMGSDFSQQQVIKKNDNVLLEELSGHYYFKAFWALTKSKQQAHFIAATGVSNIELLANMFLGWGLEFIAVLDDEPSARAVYGKMKRNMFGDDETVAKANMLKLKGCSGIEDVFTKADFRKWVLCDETINYEEANSEYVKNNHRPKAVLAYQFLLSLNSTRLSLKDFEEGTRTRITEFVGKIETMLKAAKA